VVSYNADGPIIKGVATPGTNRLCYVGQALYLSGQQMGERIKSLAKPGHVVIFIATPGSANIQPRFDGAASVLTPAGYTVKSVATGASTSGEGNAEKAYLLGNKSGLVAACAVDAGSTELLGPQLKAVGLTIPAGGFDLTPGTLTAIQNGQLNFTINQDPYLQGFLPTLYLYLFNLTGGLVLPPDTDTGLTFVTKSNVGPYINTKTTYLGSTGATQPTLVPPRPAPDGHRFEPPHWVERVGVGYWPSDTGRSPAPACCTSTLKGCGRGERHGAAQSCCRGRSPRRASRPEWCLGQLAESRNVCDTAAGGDRFPGRGAADRLLRLYQLDRAVHVLHQDRPDQPEPVRGTDHHHRAR